MKTLLIIDVQNDFLPGGSLAVPQGDEIVDIINRLQPHFELIIATQDWHPVDHSSFAVNHKGKKEFDTIQLHGQDQVLWPNHCVQNTAGADLYSKLNIKKAEAIFRKGMDPEIDSYSAFYDNAHLKSTGLSGYLKEKEAGDLFFTGLAGDYCVYFSMLDALKDGFKATLIEDATRAIDAIEFQNVKQEILKKGGKIVQSSELTI